MKLSETSTVFLASCVTAQQSCSHEESHYLGQSGFSKRTEQKDFDYSQAVVQVVQQWLPEGRKAENTVVPSTWLDT